MARQHLLAGWFLSYLQLSLPLRHGACDVELDGFPSVSSLPGRAET